MVCRPSSDSSFKQMRRLTHQTPNDAAPGVRTGEIFRISPVDVCYFADLASDEAFCCTFDKIKDYGGEQPAEFGMLPGSPVHFALDDQREIAWVELI